MTTTAQITDYLARVKRYAHAQTLNNPLEVMPSRHAYPALKAPHVWRMVQSQADRVFANHKVAHEWPAI